MLTVVVATAIVCRTAINDLHLNSWKKTLNVLPDSSQPENMF